MSNIQVKRFNGTIWKATLLALGSCNLSEKHWELIHPQMLHSLRSLLLYTATNTTLNKYILFYFFICIPALFIPWKLTAFLANDTWTILLKMFVRNSKNYLFMDQAELLDSNSTYVNIRYPSGQELTVSLCDLVACCKVQII